MPLLTLSFLLKIHSPNRQKALTSKGDTFHHWPVAKPEDLYFQNKNKHLTSPKKKKKKRCESYPKSEVVTSKSN